jgi:hypothetical protein
MLQGRGLQWARPPASLSGGIVDMTNGRDNSLGHPRKIGQTARLERTRPHSLLNDGSALKGTGFSPFINPRTMNGALAPEEYSFDPYGLFHQAVQSCHKRSRFSSVILSAAAWGPHSRCADCGVSGAKDPLFNFCVRKGTASAVPLKSPRRAK